MVKAGHYIGSPSGRPLALETVNIKVRLRTKYRRGFRFATQGAILMCKFNTVSQAHGVSLNLALDLAYHA